MKSKLLLLPFIFLCTFLLLSPTQAQTQLLPTCSEKLQDRINAASIGSTVTPRTDCIYREAVTINKGISLDGQGTAEIRGSDVWTGWTQSGSTWVSTLAVPTFFNGGGQCGLIPGTTTVDQKCLWPEQVFFDGQPLTQVSSTTTPVSGQFSVNSSRKVVLGDNPTGHTLEVSMRQYWVKGGAANVTVKGFTMKHAAAAINQGGISNSTYANWTIENNSFSHVHGYVVYLQGNTTSLVPGLRLLNNDIAYGGNLGVGGPGFTDGLIQGNKIHDNNTENFSMGFQSGGLKIAGGTSNTILDNNEVYNNKGPGLWCDGDCQNITFSNNRIHDNYKYGISYEISNGAKIFGNKTWNNGIGFSNSAFGAGILCQSCSNTEIYNNVSAWDRDGIGVIEEARTEYNSKYAKITNNYVHDNVIIKDNDPAAVDSDLSLGWLSNGAQPDGTRPIFDPASNNRGENNKYWFTQPEGTSKVRFAWNLRAMIKLVDFNATQGEENGRYITSSEKDQILTTNCIPLSQDGMLPLECTTTPTPTNVSTPATSYTPTPTPKKLGDVDGDGHVTIADFNEVVGMFGRSQTNPYLDADLDKSGRVWIEDFNEVIAYFGS